MLADEGSAMGLGTTVPEVCCYFSLPLEKPSVRAI